MQIRRQRVRNKGKLFIAGHDVQRDQEMSFPLGATPVLSTKSWRSTHSRMTLRWSMGGKECHFGRKKTNTQIKQVAEGYQFVIRKSQHGVSLAKSANE